MGSFVIRTSPKLITPANMFSDLYFGYLGSNLLPSLTTMVKHVLMPALKAQVSYFVIITFCVCFEVWYSSSDFIIHRFNQ